MIGRVLRKLKNGFALLLTALLLLFAIVNHEFVAISLFPLPYEIEIPKFLLALACFGVGLLVGGIVMSHKLGRALRLFKKSHERAMALENELKSLHHTANLHEVNRHAS